MLATTEPAWLQGFGIAVDDGLNEACVGKAGRISPPGCRVECLVIPTDEELSIAQQTLEVLEQHRAREQ